jgi:hypothetical protein
MLEVLPITSFEDYKTNLGHFIHSTDYPLTTATAACVVGWCQKAKQKHPSVAQVIFFFTTVVWFFLEKSYGPVYT